MRFSLLTLTFLTLITFYGFAQDKSEEIKTNLQSYAAFENVDIAVENDAAEGVYLISLTKNNITLQGQVFDVNDKYLSILKLTDKINVNDLMLGKAEILQNTNLEMPYLIVANEDMDITKKDLPKSYQYEIYHGLKENKDQLFDYTVSIQKGVNLFSTVDTASVNFLQAPNKDHNKSILLSTHLGTEMLAYFMGNPKANENIVNSFKLGISLFNFVKNSDTYQFQPIVMNGSIATDELSFQLKSSLHVNNPLSFLGLQDIDQPLVGQLILHPDPKIPFMQFGSAEKESHQKSLDGGISLKNIGFNIEFYASEENKPDKKATFQLPLINIDILSDVSFNGKNYTVNFWKNDKGEYAPYFPTIDLTSVLGKPFSGALLNDLFKESVLHNVSIGQDFFEGELPFHGMNMDMIGFKNASGSDYNFVFNFPSVDISDILQHDADIHFPEIILPDNMLAFWMPEGNSSDARFKIPSITSIPSPKFQSFFGDNTGIPFPDGGFDIGQGISFENIEFPLVDLFGGSFEDLGISDALSGIKISSLNITSSSINCKFPIFKGIDIDVSAFKVPGMPKLNYLFNVPEVSLTNYFSGLEGTPLADLGSLENVKLMMIPQSNFAEFPSVSFAGVSLPKNVALAFPELNKSDGSDLGSPISFKPGLNINCPFPSLSGDLKNFMDAIGSPDLSKLRLSGKLSPKMLSNWKSWNNSPNQPKSATSNPQVEFNEEVAEDTDFDIPLPEFTIGEVMHFESPVLSLGGIEVDIFALLDKDLKNTVKVDNFKTVISSDILLDYKEADDLKTYRFNNSKLFFDRGNQTYRIAWNLEADSAHNEAQYNKDGNIETKRKYVPTSIVSSEHFSQNTLSMDAYFQKGSKLSFKLGGDATVTTANGTKAANVSLELVEQNDQKNLVFNLTSNDGFSITDFSTIDFPNYFQNIAHLKIYDVEATNNYFFFGFSADSIIQNNFENSEYLLGFKSKGQTGFNLGVKSKSFITSLLQDLPSGLNISNIHNEKIIYVPSGNELTGLDVSSFPEKVQKHFNSSQLEKIDLHPGLSFNAFYTGAVNIVDFKLELTDIPIGIDFIGDASSGSNSSSKDGTTVHLELPGFDWYGFQFSDALYHFEKKEGHWNTSIDAAMEFKYYDIDFKADIIANPFDSVNVDDERVKGVWFQSKNNLEFDLPEPINFAHYKNIVLSGNIERTHEITTLTMEGDLSVGSKDFHTTAELLQKKGEFDDIIFKVHGDEIALKDIPVLIEIPDANKIFIKDPEISLKYIAGQIRYDNIITQSALFHDAGNWSLIFSLEDFTFDKVIPELNNTFLKGATLPKTLFSISNAAMKKKVSDLPKAVATYFEKIYQEDRTVDIAKGVAMFTSFNPAQLPGEGIGDFFTTIGMNTEFAFEGAIGGGPFGGSPSFYLSAIPTEVIEMGKDDKFGFIQDVDAPTVFIKYEDSRLDFGLETFSHFKIDKDKLNFHVQLGLQTSSEAAPQILLQGEMEGDWHDPMGLTGLSFTDVSVGASGGLDGSIGINFSGKTTIGTDSLFVAASIPASPVITNLGLCAKANHLGLSTFAEIANLLAEGKLNTHELPAELMYFEDVALAFVPPSAQIHCSDEISGIDGGGVALKGKAFFRDLASDNVIELASLDASAGLFSGLNIQAELHDIDLEIMKLTGANLDIVAKIENLKPVTHFKMHGKTEVVGASNEVTVNFSPSEIYFQTQTNIEHLGEGTLTAKTTDGIHLNPDNTLIASIEFKNDVPDLVGVAGDELASELDKLDADYQKAEDDLQTAMDELNKKKKAVEDAKKDVMNDRKDVEDAINKAQSNLDDVKGDKNNARSKVKKYKKKYWDCAWWDLDCQTSNAAKWTEWSTKYESYKVAYETAKAVLNAAKSAMDATPIELDPRVVGPLAELNTAKAGVAMVQAIISSLRTTNQLLSDASKAVSFKINDIKLEGDLNAFSGDGTKVILDFDADFMNENYKSSKEISLNDVENMAETVWNEVVNTTKNVSKSHSQKVKNQNNADEYYIAPSNYMVEYRWAKQAGWATQLASSKDTLETLFAIGYTDKLYYSKDQGKSWNRVANADLYATNMTTDHEGNLWYIDKSNHAIYKTTDVEKGTPDLVDNSKTFVDIALDKTGNIWALAGNIGDYAGGASIYFYDAKQEKWTKKDGQGVKIEVDQTNAPWHLNKVGKIYKMDLTTNKWDYLGDNYSRINTASNGQIITVTKDHKFKRYDATTEDWGQESGLGIEFTADEDYLYAIGGDHSIWFAQHNAEGNYKRFDKTAEGRTMIVGDIGGIMGVSGTDKIYVFSGSDYVRWDTKNGEAYAKYDYPKPINDWKGFPGKYQVALGFGNAIDACMYHPNWKRGYFFHEDEYMAYDMEKNKMLDGYPKKISTAWSGFPPSFQQGIDAATNSPDAKKAWVFKGDEYVAYNWDENKAYSGYPKKIKDMWHGLPEYFHNNLDAVVCVPAKNKVYFFKGKYYVRYDLKTNKCDWDNKVLIQKNWN